MLLGSFIAIFMDGIHINVSEAFWLGPQLRALCTLTCFSTSWSAPWSTGYSSWFFLFGSSWRTPAIKRRNSWRKTFTFGNGTSARLTTSRTLNGFFVLQVLCRYFGWNLLITFTISRSSSTSTGSWSNWRTWTLKQCPYRSPLLQSVAVVARLWNLRAPWPATVWTSRRNNYTQKRRLLLVAVSINVSLPYIVLHSICSFMTVHNFLRFFLFSFLRSIHCRSTIWVIRI